MQLMVSAEVYNFAFHHLPSIFQELLLQFVKAALKSYVHQHSGNSCQLSAVGKFCL